MVVRTVECKSAASRSGLPGLDKALNPYRGCSHRCAYCYAQDVTRFEMSKPWGMDIEVKLNLVERLSKELKKDSSGVFGIGTVTDPYQPLEEKYELTRGCLIELRRTGASISVLTKSDLVLRDLDLLRGWEDAEVGVSIGCTDARISSILEPGAPVPERRLAALKALNDASIKTYIMAAPVIVGVSDLEQQLRELVAGASEAGVMRIMWDKFNPKPIAGRRLREALLAHGMKWQVSGPQDVDRIQAILRRESALAGIELMEAF